MNDSIDSIDSVRLSRHIRKPGKVHVLCDPVRRGCGREIPVADSGQGWKIDATCGIKDGGCGKMWQVVFQTAVVNGGVNGGVNGSGNDKDNDKEDEGEDGNT